MPFTFGVKPPKCSDQQNTPRPKTLTSTVGPQMSEGQADSPLAIAKSCALLSSPSTSFQNLKCTASLVEFTCFWKILNTDEFNQS